MSTLPASYPLVRNILNSIYCIWAICGLAHTCTNTWCSHPGPWTEALLSITAGRGNHSLVFYEGGIRADIVFDPMLYMWGPEKTLASMAGEKCSLHMMEDSLLVPEKCIRCSNISPFKLTVIILIDLTTGMNKILFFPCYSLVCFIFGKTDLSSPDFSIFTTYWAELPSQPLCSSQESSTVLSCSDIDCFVCQVLARHQCLLTQLQDFEPCRCMCSYFSQYWF